jgi:DNA polymerase III epsilon subunit-like protein
MCVTALGAELTRVSVLGHDGSLLLDTLVKPASPVLDYVTQYSGITEEMLRDVTVTIEQVRYFVSPWRTFLFFSVHFVSLAIDFCFPSRCKWLC